LAVAAALVSALADKPLPQKSSWFGEVSLAGEIRPVAHADLRTREAAKLGFAKGYGPSDAKTGSSKLDYKGLGQLSNLVDHVMGNA
jgi:DNA repair protein RadA/Sms